MIYFAGDFHLGAPDRASSDQREKDVCAWLNFAGQQGNEIFLMGDVFDFWFEYKMAVPKGYFKLLSTMASITERGIPITIFKGNHDMWMFGYLEEYCGVKIISDELEITRNGKRFFLHHGDGLGPGDFTYKVVRKIFRSAWAQWLFARLHPNAGIAFATFLSKSSRISKKDHKEKFQGKDKEFLVQFCIKNANKYDYMIFGHRHLVLDIQIGENCRYINNGEWVTGRNYTVFDGDTVRLETFQNPSE